MNRFEASSSPASPPAVRFGLTKQHRTTGTSSTTTTVTEKAAYSLPAEFRAVTWIEARPAATPVTVTVEPSSVTVATEDGDEAA